MSGEERTGLDMPVEVLRFRGSGRHSLGASIPPEQHGELCAWVSSLGVDPQVVLPWFVIRRWRGRYQLHLSVKVRPDGRDVVDEALSKVWSEPLVVDLGTERCWPLWLHDTSEQP